MQLFALPMFVLKYEFRCLFVAAELFTLFVVIILLAAYRKKYRY